MGDNRRHAVDFPWILVLLFRIVPVLPLTPRELLSAAHVAKVVDRIGNHGTVYAADFGGFQYILDGRGRTAFLGSDVLVKTRACEGFKIFRRKHVGMKIDNHYPSPCASICGKARCCKIALPCRRC